MTNLWDIDLIDLDDDDVILVAEGTIGYNTIHGYVTFVEYISDDYDVCLVISNETGREHSVYVEDVVWED